MRRPELLLLACLACQSSTAGALSADRQDALKHLLYQDCGSCHGLQLTGGLGPALTPVALAGKSRRLLFDTIRDGRSGTPMPPWSPLLADEEITWLVDYMLQQENTP